MDGEQNNKSKGPLWVTVIGLLISASGNLVQCGSLRTKNAEVRVKEAELLELRNKRLSAERAEEDRKATIARQILRERDEISQIEASIRQAHMDAGAQNMERHFHPENTMQATRAIAEIQHHEEELEQQKAQAENRIRSLERSKTNCVVSN
jgi:chromosome segregation ATPase